MRLWGKRYKDGSWGAIQHTGDFTTAICGADEHGLFKYVELVEAARLASVEEERREWEKNYHDQTLSLGIVEKERDDLREQLEREKGERERLENQLTEVDNVREECRIGWGHARKELKQAESALAESQSRRMELAGDLGQARVELAAALEEVERLKYWESMVCPRCHGVGEITVSSGQTPDSYQEENIVCPDCIGAVIGEYEDRIQRLDERVAELDGLAYSNGELYNKEYKLRESLESQLAAQSSAKGEYRRGMERAAEVLDMTSTDVCQCKGCKTLRYGSKIIRAEANQTAQEEGGTDI